jgi:hypothetical protein
MMRARRHSTDQATSNGRRGASMTAFQMITGAMIVLSIGPLLSGGLRARR